MIQPNNAVYLIITTFIIDHHMHKLCFYSVASGERFSDIMDLLSSFTILSQKQSKKLI